jgi:hypothetical protein
MQEIMYVNVGLLLALLLGNDTILQLVLLPLFCIILLSVKHQQRITISVW